MLSIRKVNPMARAIGTMGAVAVLVGAVTFAALQTNNVGLTDNTLTSGTPLLQIASGNLPFANNAPGLTASLTPGIPKSFTFYLQNNDTQPLAITANVPTVFDSGAILPSSVTMTLDCGGGGVTYPLSSWAAGSAVIPGTVAPGTFSTCTETVTLDSTYGNSGNALKPYTINFVGNESSS